MTISRTGTTGKDTFEAGLEEEAFDGDREYDTVSYRGATEGLTLDLAAPANSTGYAAGDSYVSIERFLLSHFADTFIGSAANEAVNGADGDDFLYGGDGRDTLTGHVGNDSLFGENGNDGMFGGGGNDTLSGGEGDDGLRGDGGDDSLHGGAGADRLFGGTGNDTLIGGTGDDTVTGEAGDDLLIYTFGDGADSLSGDVGNDTLVFALSSADLDQDIEDDLRNLQAHMEARFAGAGGNIAALAGETSGALTYFAHLGFSLSTIENVVVEMDGVRSDLSTFIDGLGPQPMTLVDLPGNQVLTGGDADDLIVAGDGNDVYDGGAGVDTLDVSGAAQRAVVDLNAGTARGLGTDTVSNIENVIGSDGNDVLRGDGGNNQFIAGAGHDRLNGRNGNDVIDGGEGNDRINGGSGADTLDGGEGNDRLNGGSGSDVLADGAGNDRVNGGNGNDTVIAGTGRDNFNGGRGFDTLDFSNAAVALDINLAARRVTSDDGNDRVSNFESIIGSNFNDTILGGNRGGEQLNGGAGDDVIRSLRGEDVVTGGMGTDTFVFEATDVVRGRRTYGADEVEDYTTEDVLDFSGLFSGTVVVGEDLALVEDGGNTTISAQIGRNGAFVEVVQLNNVTGLTIADMIDDGQLIV